MLRPGGRVAVSDIAIKKALPPEVGEDLMAYIGCIAGAVPIEEYVAGLKAAGFSAVQVVDAKKDLNAYAQVEGQAGCCSPAMETPAPAGSSACCAPRAGEPMSVTPESACCAPAPSDSSSCCTPNARTEPASVHGGLAELLRKFDVNEFAASVQVYAVKS